MRWGAAVLLCGGLPHAGPTTGQGWAQQTRWQCPKSPTLQMPQAGAGTKRGWTQPQALALLRGRRERSREWRGEVGPEKRGMSVGGVF